VGRRREASHNDRLASRPAVIRPRLFAYSIWEPTLARHASEGTGFPREFPRLRFGLVTKVVAQNLVV
jgi:hypothetical protein